MIEIAENQFQPDYVVPPGDVLEDYLESHAMTQAGLAERTGLAKKTVNEIVKGKAPITPEMALRFERVFSRPAGFWNNLERLFQEDRARLFDRERLKAGLEWLRKVPVNEMTKHGRITNSLSKVPATVELWWLRCRTKSTTNASAEAPACISHQRASRGDGAQSPASRVTG